MKPQYETWSASKLTGVKVIGLIETDSFPNAKFKVVRGSTSQVYKFTLANLPCLNPYDWIILYNMMLKEKEKYESVMSHLEIMLQSYIQEVGEMDVEIVVVLRKKPSTIPKEAPKDFEKLKPEKIYKEGWFVVYQSSERTGADFHKFCFFLSDKHLNTTSLIEFILDLLTKFKGNSKEDLKCFSDMILWYIRIRKLLVSFFSKIYEVQKRIQG